MSRVLIIEDEKNLARFVELELKHEGYETDVRYDGRNGLEAALDEKESWDVILLDVMLPIKRNRCLSSYSTSQQCAYHHDDCT